MTKREAPGSSGTNEIPPDGIEAVVSLRTEIAASTEAKSPFGSGSAWASPTVTVRLPTWTVPGVPGNRSAPCTDGEYGSSDAGRGADTSHRPTGRPKAGAKTTCTPAEIRSPPVA